MEAPTPKRVAELQERCGLAPAIEREIDRLLAVSLFDWQRDASGRIHPPGPQNGNQTSMPFWTATWNGAGQITEAMRARGFAVRLTATKRDPSSVSPGHWLASFGDSKDLGVQARTAPCAIALAALRTLGLPFPPDAHASA